MSKNRLKALKKKRERKQILILYDCVYSYLYLPFLLQRAAFVPVPPAFEQSDEMHHIVGVRVVQLSESNQ